MRQSNGTLQFTPDCQFLILTRSVADVRRSLKRLQRTLPSLVGSPTVATVSRLLVSLSIRVILLREETEPTPLFLAPLLTRTWALSAFVALCPAGISAVQPLQQLALMSSGVTSLSLPTRSATTWESLLATLNTRITPVTPPTWSPSV